MGRGLSAAARRPRRRLPQRSGEEHGRTWPGYYVHLPRPHSRGCRKLPVRAALLHNLRRLFRHSRPVQFLRAVSPVLERDDIRAVSDYGSTNGQVFGVAPDYNQIRTIPISPGRWFNAEDNTQHRRVAVVGWELLKNMFPGEPAVGSTIMLNDMDFKVIGVVPKIGKDGENGTNHRIFVPFDTMRNLFPLKAQNSENAISFLNYRPIKKELHLEAKNEVHAIIARRHGFDPSLDDAFNDWDTIDGAIRVAKIFDAMDWFPGRGGSRNSRPGRHRHHQYHARLGDRANPGNRPSQSSGRNPPQYHDSVLYRRRVSYYIQRWHRPGDLHCFRDSVGAVAFAGGFRHAANRARFCSDCHSFSLCGRHRCRSLSRPQSRSSSPGGSAPAGVAIDDYVGDLGKQAFGALKHNRRRSLLTMLGMAWGIATVVLLLAYGAGFQNALMIAFRTFGGNLIGIFPGRTSLQAGGTKAGAQVRLTRDDLDFLRAEVPMLTRISPEVDKQSQVSFGRAVPATIFAEFTRATRKFALSKWVRAHFSASRMISLTPA